MRLLQARGPVPPVRRMGAQPWDIGGFFDMSVRSLGPIDELIASFCRGGFSAFAPIADFEMAGLKVREVLAHDGDGLCFAMAKRFFIDIFGWEALVDTALVHPDGRNVMGLPLDIAREHEVRLAIVQQQGRMEGSVELIEYPCESTDFLTDKPHYRGLASLCFPVSDLAGVITRSAAAGCAVGDPREVVWTGLGKVRAGWVLTPWAARFVFFEPF